MHLTTLADRLGDKPAYVMGGSGASLSYRELEARSNQVARLLHELGLRAGDSIAILMENRLDYFPIAWAAQRSGLYYAPVNWHLAAGESAYIVDNCDAQVLFSSPQLESLATASAAAAPRLRARFVVDDAETEAPFTTDAARLTDALAGVGSSPLAEQVEGAYMFYSSGTTGQPKGVRHVDVGTPFGTAFRIDHLMHDAFGFDAETTFLVTGPLYHAAPLGWAMGTIRNGGTAVVMERFDAAACLDHIQSYRVTHAQFVPTMFVRMLKLPAVAREIVDVSSLRNVIHAAAPCPVDVKEQMIEWFGPIVTEFYAGTEGVGFCMIDSATWLAHKGSVGQVKIGEVHICDAEGTELPVGEVGTIWFGGAGGFTYYKEPAKTASAYNDRGWATLGDIGHVDADGFLYLSGRRTDLILSGGVNIYPREIEDALIMHRAVVDVAVIGRPDPEWGQRVHAVVQLTPGFAGSTDLEAELTEFARAHIAGYKVPRTIEFVDDFPRLPSGKILRRALME
jgi:acyl-CoA synthetase (AMP-forming)/AMP-acid ligase II